MIRRLVIVKTEDSYQRCRQQSKRRDFEVDHVHAAFRIVSGGEVSLLSLVPSGIGVVGQLGLTCGQRGCGFWCDLYRNMWPPRGKVCSEGSSCSKYVCWNAGALPWQ